MSMVPHTTAVCKSAFFQLRNISMIRKFHTTETTKTPVHAFVTSKIDYCDSLLFGAPKYLLHRLQRVFNFAAIIVYQCFRGEVLPEKSGGGVQPTSQNPYPIYDQNLRVLLPYLRPGQTFDTLFMTVAAGTVSLSICYEGLLLTVLIMMKK